MAEETSVATQLLMKTWTMWFLSALLPQPTTTHFLSGGGMLGSSALPLPFLLALVRSRVAHSPQYAWDVR